MDPRFLVLYFVLGGLVVTLTTYFGSHSQGFIAAFVAFFPSITVVSILAIYFHGGNTAVTSYLKDLLLLIPAWLLYIAAVLLLVPRLGVFLSLGAGVFLYIVASFVITRVF